jgi:O-antigen/teichoic acid export membrane protein
MRPQTYFRRLAGQVKGLAGQMRMDVRYGWVAWSVVANMSSRLLAMVVMVLTVRLTVPYLGVERYGVWMTVASFAGLLAFLDMGVGNALTNKVAQALASEDKKRLRATIGSGVLFLAVLSVCMGILMLLLGTLFPLHTLIKTKDVGLVDEIDNTFLVFVFFFASNLFSTGVLRVFAGLQRSFEVGLVSCAGSVLTMVLIWVATRVHAGIPVLFAVTFGVQALIGIVLLALLRRRQLIDCSGGLLQVISSGREYLGAGSLFLLLQIGAMIGWGADTLIISTSLGVAQVAIFNVTQRLFFFVNQPLSILNAPLWVTYAEANHKGDKNFLRSTLKRALVATFILALLGAVFLCWAGQFLIEHWTQGVIAVPMGRMPFPCS